MESKATETKATETKATTHSTHSSLPRSLPPLVQTATVDLHGLSVEKAKRLVASQVAQARSRGFNKIRFITGRGNHINARGERGTMYKGFKDWLKNVENDIVKVEQYDGYYEVDIKENVTAHLHFSTFMREKVWQFRKENIERIKKEAESGDVESIIELAICYDQGIGVEQSYQKATALYMRLAEKEKLASAQYEAGCRLYIGKGIKQNDPQAIKFLTLAADQGYVLAEFMLGELYSKGFDAVSIDHSVATEYYRKAAEHGHAEAARKLGYSYHSGTGIKTDQAQAIHWWEIACRLGDGTAAFNLSAAYQDGSGVPEDLKKSVHYLTLAAEKNDPDGQQILGICYYYGEKGLPKDEQKGLQWMRRAADNGSSQALFFLFQHHKSLNETKLAKEYLIKAALDGLIEAQFLITMSRASWFSKIIDAKESKVETKGDSKRVDSDNNSFTFDPDLQKQMEERLLHQPASAVLQMMSNGSKHLVVDLLLCSDSTKKQMKKGVAILEKLAEEKCEKALVRLGTIYTLGGMKIIKKNPKKGEIYWLQGAALGNSDCLCSLGHFWYLGAGGRANYKKAFDYFLQAAEKNNANAINTLGTFYREGKCGIKKDLNKAVHYFELAMKLDNPEKRKELRQERGESLSSQSSFKHAAKNLAILYLNGDEGFAKDEAKGFELLKQSAEDGMDDAAWTLSLHYMEKRQSKEFLYYLNLAAQLGNKEAIRMIETMPAESKAVIQQDADRSEAKEPPKAPISNEDLIKKLKQLSSCFVEALDWRIARDNRAWASISGGLQKKLIQVNELSRYVKKASGGSYLIVIDNIHQCKLDELCNLFEKAIAPSSGADSLAVDSTAALLAKHSFLADNSASDNASSSSTAAALSNIGGADALDNNHEMLDEQSADDEEEIPSSYCVVS